MTKFIIFYIAFTFNVSIKAGERFEFYNGARQLGMGGASIGVVNDETAVLLNPAGMGKLRNAFVTLVDPEIHVSGPASQTLLTGGSLSTLNDAQGMADTLGTTADKSTHFGYQVFPSFVLPNFGIGMLASSFWDGQTDSTGANVFLRKRSDVAVVLGYNLTFLDGRLKVGFNGRYVTRTLSEIDTATGGSYDFATNEGTGTGLAIDSGIIFSAPWASLPSLSVVLRDFGDTNYTISSSGTAVPSTPQTIDAAISFFPIHSNHVRSSFTFEYRDILNAYDETDLSRRLHSGWELNLGDLFFIRAGWHQNSWTAGLEFAMERAQFQISTYAEDVGTDGAGSINDRRYISKFVFRF
ncbi:MAG: hypothetical protein AB8E15_06985 [Bdellovibrionales bacterium]